MDVIITEGRIARLENLNAAERATYQLLLEENGGRLDDGVAARLMAEALDHNSALNKVQLRKREQARRDALMARFRTRSS